MAHRRLGNVKDALEAHRQALKIQQEQGDVAGEASTRHALALAYEEMGQTERAAAYYEWALRLRRKIKDEAGEAITCYNLSKLYKRLGYLDEAEELLARTVAIEEQANHPDYPKDEAELAALRARRRGEEPGSRDTSRWHQEPPIPGGGTTGE
jgi:tetratricopeptide (TPR) repeat protein